mmetsp:Transcript_49798/g.155851  ORF Transcript_49798/g.155851 Transcript_49798/m.155851 type:complete len:254 (-) Transcript_49798:277-1038(-)
MQWQPPLASLHPHWLPSTRTFRLSDPPLSPPPPLSLSPAIRPSPLAGLVELSLFVEEQRKSLGSVLACLPPLSRSSETLAMPDIMAERCRETSKQPGPQVSPASQKSCPGAAGRHLRGEHALVGLCLYGHQAAKLCVCRLLVRLLVAPQRQSLQARGGCKAASSRALGLDICQIYGSHLHPLAVAPDLSRQQGSCHGCRLSSLLDHGAGVDGDVDGQIEMVHCCTTSHTHRLQHLSLAVVARLVHGGFFLRVP